MLKTYLIQVAPVFLLALAMALVWTFLTRHMYGYNMPFPIVFGLSTFPVIAWTIALTVGFVLVNRLLARMNVKRFTTRFAFAALLYAIAVVAVETIGYYWVGIQNISTSQYTGLPLCGCLHAPGWMQIGYFALGPLHWLLTKSVYLVKPLVFFRPI